MSQIVDIFSFCLDSPFFCNADQLVGIFYFIVTVCCCFIQSMTDFTTMVGMGCSAACCKFQVVSSYNTMSITSTDSAGSFWSNAAWAHRTDTTADTLLTEFTVRSLVLHTKLPSVSTYFCTCLEEPVCRCLEFFYSC